MDNARRLALACLPVLGFFLNGLHVGAIGPSLDVLREQVGATVPVISLIITMEAIGYAVGAVICKYAFMHPSSGSPISDHLVDTQVA